MLQKEEREVVRGWEKRDLVAKLRFVEIPPLIMPALHHTRPYQRSPISDADNASANRALRMVAALRPCQETPSIPLWCDAVTR